LCTPGFFKDVRVQFEGGVIIAADTLGSYGSLAKITNLDRVIKVRNINLQYIRSLNATWYWYDITAPKEVDRYRYETTGTGPYRTYVTRYIQIF
jgi:hypothetical protein